MIFFEGSVSQFLTIFFSPQGEWSPKKIDNPNYKGKWVHPEIENPDYEADENLYRYTSSGAIGFDLWQVSMLWIHKGWDCWPVEERLNGPIDRFN